MKKIAVIPGDGIGIEVIEGAVKILKKSEDILFGKTMFDFHYFDWGTDYYLKNNRMMPKNALDLLSEFDSILLGAVGHPKVPDHITLNGLLLPIRRRFDQYVSIRPCYLWENTESVLKNVSDLDFVIIRENSEGEYANIGGFLHTSNEYDTSIQTSVFTRMGCMRIIEYAFEHAVKRNNKLKVTSVTKSNAQAYGMVMWDDCFNTVAKKYPNIKTESLLVDAACMDFIRKPETFDVVVASNLFGDILTDIGAIITGSMGLAPSGNIDPSYKYPSMFEPVHGSAPDIVNEGIANPMAAIFSGAMMLSHLGEKKLSLIMQKAVEQLISEGNSLTKDLGGTSSTSEVGNSVVEYIKDLY